MFMKNDAGELVFRVEEKKTFRQNHEVAAWYTEVEVEAGDYPARIQDRNWISTTLTGVIVDDHCPPLFGGVQQGPASKAKVGREGSVYIGNYLFLQKNEEELRGVSKEEHV